MTDSFSSDYDGRTRDYMSDPDDFIYSSETDLSGGWSASVSTSEQVTRGPIFRIVAAYAVNTVSLFFLLTGSNLVNWIGYILSGFLAAGLMVSYWHIDQQRRRFPTYVLIRSRSFWSALSLGIGILLAGLHAVALSQNVVLA